jgi:uncharacterized protein
MASPEPSRVLVTGVSGPIGAALVPSLKARGGQVTRLVRGPISSENQISWDPAKPLSPNAVSGFDAVIHLAGETVMGRWTTGKKTKIRESRVLGTRNLAQAMAQAQARPRVLISASAIGYYGNRGDEVLREDSAPGNGFLAEVCREWEEANQPAAAAGVRTVQMRIGVVLSPTGGALQKILPAFRMGVGGNIGSGRQWMSWIHVQDLVGAVHHILTAELLQGPMNLVAPRPATNAEFTTTLGAVLSRPTIFPVPVFALKLAFGQMGEEVLLASQRVEPGKLAASGYCFQYSDLRAALEALLKSPALTPL